MMVKFIDAWGAEAIAKQKERHTRTHYPSGPVNIRNDVQPRDAERENIMQ
jgi:hypothetical protein